LLSEVFKSVKKTTTTKNTKKTQTKTQKTLLVGFDLDVVYGL
jgi:hypothetical protein